MLHNVLRWVIASHSYRFYNFTTSLSFAAMYWANLKQKKRIWKLFFLIFPNFSNPHFSKDLTYEKTGKVKKYSVTTIVLTFTVWITCSSVILNFSRVLRSIKVNLKNITTHISISTLEKVKITLEQIFLTVGQNNYGIKIVPFIISMYFKTVEGLGTI